MMYEPTERWMMTVVKCPRIGPDWEEPPFFAGDDLDRTHIAQGLTDGFLPVGAVVRDRKGTCWMAYPVEGEVRLLEAEWDDEAGDYLLVPDGRQLRSSEGATGLRKVKR